MQKANHLQIFIVSEMKLFLIILALQALFYIGSGNQGLYILLYLYGFIYNTQAGRDLAKRDTNNGSIDCNVPETYLHVLRGRDGRDGLYQEGMD